MTERLSNDLGTILIYSLINKENNIKKKTLNKFYKWRVACNFNLIVILMLFTILPPNLLLKVPIKYND